MVPSTRPFDLASQNRRTGAVISLYLSDDGAIDSFTAAMTIGRASEVYNSKSRNHQAHQRKVNEHDQASGPYLSVGDASNAPQGSAQALMRTGLAYMTRAMRKLNHLILNSEFPTGDQVIANVLDLLVCEVLMGGVARGETHCQG